MERHPLLPQWELLDYCARQGIVVQALYNIRLCLIRLSAPNPRSQPRHRLATYVQAHTPLGRGSPFLLQHSEVIRVAREASFTPAQVLIQWNLRHGVCVATKVSSIDHTRQVIAASSLTANVLTALQMQALDAIGGGATSLSGAGSGSGPQRRFVNPPFMCGSASPAYRFS